MTEKGSDEAGGRSNDSVLGDPELDQLCVSILTQHVEDCDREAGKDVDRLWERIKAISEHRRSFFRAELETRNFSFEGYGATAEQALASCREGWEEHCRSYRPGMEIDPDQIGDDDIAVYQVELGKAYRDREPV